MGNLLARLWKEEEGQDLVEYVLLAALVALAATAALKNVATALTAAFSNAVMNMSSTTT
jgi:pilus assembly protein Flp/PilA